MTPYYLVPPVPGTRETGDFAKRDLRVRATIEVEMEQSEVK